MAFGDMHKPWCTLEGKNGVVALALIELLPVVLDRHYAAAICLLLDPTRELFGDRVVANAGVNPTEGATAAHLIKRLDAQASPGLSASKKLSLRHQQYGTNMLSCGLMDTKLPSIVGTERLGARHCDSG